MFVTLSILAGAAFFFVQGSVRSDMVAASALLLLVLFGVLTPEEALSGFSSNIVIMLVCVFIVGGAVFRTGLAKMISKRILRLAGNNENKLFVLIMLVTASIGAFVSNSGTVAVMLPIVVSLTTAARISPSRFLMPLAFASSMGGMLTLIGTTPNLIINNALIEGGYGGLHFFSFFPVGVVCVTLGTVSLLFVSKWLLSRKRGTEDESGSGKSLRELADKYRLAQNVYRVRVLPGSPLIGIPLAALDLPEKYAASVVEIRRRSPGRGLFSRPDRQIIPDAGSELAEQDIVSFVGPFEELLRMAEKDRLELLDATAVKAAATEEDYRFDAMGICEVVLLSTSRLIKHTVGESGLRERFGVSIIGIQRQNESILRKLRDERLQAGDALLVQGEWGKIARLADEQNEWVVVGQPMDAASKETLDHKAPIAAGIIVLMIASMVAGLLAPVIAVMIAALFIIFTGCYRNIEEAYKTINWESVVLVGAMLPVSMAIEKTGAAALASQALIDAFGSKGPYVLMAAIYAATSVTTLFISNTATALLFTPIALQAAVGLGLSPYPFLFAVTVGAGMCFASPFSTPANVLVMSPGHYLFMDYVKVGVPLQILFGVVMVFVLPLIFPFTG